ncbi:MAG TPA: hypothetical protein VF753_04035 [Terriglobales bacterium]
MFRKAMCQFMIAVVFVLGFIPMSTFAQQAANEGNAVVPLLVNFSGVLMGVNNKPQTGTVGVTFSLYEAQEGGAPLWLETQNVQLDKTGHYSVQLGATSGQGLPTRLFAVGQARWLGVQAQGAAEQPRTLLMSVPYALKALDAETIGGKPASAFMLAPQPGKNGTSPNSPNTNITGSGTANYLPMFTGTTVIGSSKIYQSAGGKIGIGISSPGNKLDVNGTGDFRDTLTLIPSGTDPVLSVKGTALAVNNTGVITFVSGQTFPGTGTITGVTAGTGLSGGGSAGNITINNTGVLGITAGSGISSTGGQNPTLSVHGVPLLSSNNAFTATNTFAGKVGIGTTSPSHLLEVDANTNSAQMAMVSTGTDAAVSLNNTNSNGGREYWIDSGATGAGVGGGNFAVWDNTAKAVRMVINSGGDLGVGGFPSGDAQVEIDSTPFTIWALLGTGYSAPNFSGDDGDDGVYGYGGFGDVFTAGTYGGWGLFGVGGEGSEGDGVGGLFAGGSNSSSGDGIDANAGSGWAGNFTGDLNVTGTIFGGAKDFKIDDPADPANKYLYHASVESSEMMNIYSGNVTTNAGGDASVKLPSWFEALNSDFRYQLTVIGTFAQAIVAHEIENGEFAIKTNQPNVKVSWQVTAVRHDAFAKAHPLVVEQEKEAKLRGFYIHPELYGAPAQKQIEWARNPRAMKTLADRNLVRAKQQMKQKEQSPVHPAVQMKPAAVGQSSHLVK